MTDIEINIAIAKALGIKVVSDGISHNLMPCDFGGAYNPNGVSLAFIPDCCNDLNEMHSVEVEHIIPNGLWDDYVSAIKKSMRDGERFWGHADARQRAEAFVRTLGLLEEQPNETKI